RTALADALHQGGELAEATALFAEAEKMQQERQQGCDWLDSVQGFQYCDLLLASDAWPEVRRRVKKTLHWAKQDGDLLGIALDKLSLGRTASHEAIEQAGLPALSSLAPDLACVLPPGKAVEPVSGAVEAISRAVKWLNQAVDGLREAGDEELIARGLLARATRYRWAIVLLNQSDAITQALQDLQETEEIAQRSGMKLHLIDFHLEAARLALTVGKPVLNRTAIEHLTAAKKGIKETGYNRRLPEVANIEELL
ncbi:MAG: hypothetical protein D3917_21100, partial [Candidatus Electrothrix sp. AX5]|nr:hypothetical protein [Candidatus Electrothrix sp. AX5]